MNARKQQRNTRGLQRVPSVGVGKASLRAGAKRISLYPGFLMNGVASSGTRKPIGSNSPTKPEDHFLDENLQAFLDRKSVYSQRSINKHSTIEEKNPSISKHVGPVRSLRSSTLPKPIKPILKTNSKSIFKKISNKAFKIPIEPETNSNSENNIAQMDYLEEEDYNNNEIELDSSPQLIHPNFAVKHLEAFTRKMQRSFKSVYFLEKSFENVAAEIVKQKLIIEGKLPIEEEKPQDQCSNSDEDDIQHKFIPVPSERWVYKTPKNQKIKRRKVKQSQLEPALFINNKSLKIIKPIVNHNGAYNGGFEGKVPEQHPSDMVFFGKKLPLTGFIQSKFDPRVKPTETNTYLESAALDENDRVREGHNLGMRLRLQNNYKRQESSRDDYKDKKKYVGFSY